jgi:hypothetical protein
LKAPLETEGSKLWLNLGAVNDFQAATAIQGMKLSPSARCFRPDSVSDDLLEGCRGELDDFSEPKCCAISISAILNRSPKLSFQSDKVSGGTRTGSIHENGIAGMRPPWAEQMLRVVD